MLKTRIELFPWSISAPDIDQTLDHLRGEVGLDGITLSAATEGIRHLRISGEALLHETAGGLIYPPESARYPDTRIKPVSAEWAGQRNVVSHWKSACEKRGLSLRLSVATARLGRIAQRKPELSVKNVGDSRCAVTLCLTSPEVQALLLDMVLEIVDRFAPDSIELTGFESTWRLDGTELRPETGDSDWYRWLGVCVCESCRQRAFDYDIDVDDVTASIQREARRALSGDVSEELFGGQADRPLHAYLRMQQKERLRLVERLTEKSAVPILCRMPVAGFEDISAAAWRSEPRHAAINWIIRDSGEHPLMHADAATAVTSQASNSDANDFDCEAYLSHLQACEPEQLVRITTELIQAGVTGVTFGNLDLMARDVLPSVRQAVRFGRRRHSRA